MVGAVAMDAPGVRAVGRVGVKGDPTTSGAVGADVAIPPEGVTLLVAVSSAAESPETMET
jgi:hypothetical protein